MTEQVRDRSVASGTPSSRKAQSLIVYSYLEPAGSHCGRAPTGGY